MSERDDNLAPPSLSSPLEPVLSESRRGGGYSRMYAYLAGLVNEVEERRYGLFTIVNLNFGGFLSRWNRCNGRVKELGWVGIFDAGCDVLIKYLRGARGLMVYIFD